MTMFPSASSCFSSSSVSQKLFLFLLPAMMPLFGTQPIAMTATSPFIQQKDDSIEMSPFGRLLSPPISLVPNSPQHMFFVFPANLPLERPIYAQNDAIEGELGETEAKAKRAQTFVRFGKRAQTFVRFGKRAQTFVRFGRDAQRQQQQQQVENAQQQKKE